MPTNFQFSSVQIAEIQNLRNVLAQAENVSASSGAADLYSYIFKCVTGMDASSASVAAISVMSIPDNQRLSATWLYGAIQVNSDSGTFSRVIREFNIHECELRGKGKFSSAQLQEASNKVGINLADSILIASISGQPNPTYLYLPTVQEIGASDLNGVRDVLYPGNEARGSELYLNQAWPGIVMLGALGGRYTDRLLRFDDNQPISLDTLGDFKSMLFCWDSFKTAWDKTCVGTATIADAMTTMNFSSEFIAQVLGEYSANGTAGVAGMVFNALINAQQPASGLSKAMSIISVTGANKFLDMLMGAIQGKPLLGQTNDANQASATPGPHNRVMVNRWAWPSTTTQIRRPARNWSSPAPAARPTPSPSRTSTSPKPCQPPATCWRVYLRRKSQSHAYMQSSALSKCSVISGGYSR